LHNPFFLDPWAERCDLPAQITEFLRTLPEDNGERHKIIGETLKSSPNDFWLNRLFLDGSVYERSAIREKYRVKFEADRSVENQYLYGRSLVGFDTKQALRIYSEILEKDPDNPWVHYSQLEIYRSQAFRDREKLRVSFDTVTRACPSWTEPYRYLTALDDDALVPRAERLRAMLDASKDPRELRLYSTLWSAEFRLKRDQEKSRVAADLRRLHEIEGMQATIAAGAKLIGDDALAKEMTPPRSFDIFEETQAWRQSHPYPKSDDPPEKKRAYAEAALEIAATWIAQAPERIGGYSERLHALEMLDAPVEQIARAADDVVRIARADGRAGGAGFIANVAHLYVTRGILLDRVPALIEEALKMFDDPEAVIEIDLAPSHELTVQARMNNASSHVSSLVTLSEYYEKLGQMEQARSVLGPVPAFLARFPLPEGVRNVNGGHNLLVFHALANHAYWKRVGEIDEHEDKKEDALKNYREALLVWDGGRDKLLAQQRQLWKDLGRSDEEWQTWVDSIPRPAWKEQVPAQKGFTVVHRPLPRVALKDLDGAEWPVDRLLKPTIAIVWATWCEPCRRELPYFAKLAEKLNGRTDVQVISFDTDENPETAKQFVEKNGYKFPVLSAKNFAEDLMPYFSIPRTWIIRNGVILEEAEGFGGDGDQWVEHVAAQVK
jgi:thiol-disulfide isomerase/thioredoxin